MTSFVTGATGFIGQRLLVGLEANGEGVRILSRNPHPDYETVVCDLQSEVIPEVGLDGVDTVFHLAGFTHDLRDASNLEHLYRALNVDATVRLTELDVEYLNQQSIWLDMRILRMTFLKVLGQDGITH